MIGQTPARTDSESGFTLVEIVVAFAAAALLLGALYQVFSTGLRSGATADHYSRAVLLAETALEAIGTVVELSGRDERERLDGRYERRTRIRPRPDLLPADSAGANLMLYEVEVSVRWQEGPRSRSVALTSLRAGAAR
jgi:general secretion pathway protein I